MATRRSLFVDYFEDGHIPAGRTPEALRAAGIAPDAGQWRVFVNGFLLWIGALALAFAVMFFVAYNWDDIGRFAKFAMVQAAMTLAVVAYWKLGERNVAGKAALLVACILLGVLLALYGQTYQTGVDPWHLFFNWALLMLPWALIGRFAAIWIVWVGLINVSLVLAHHSGALPWLPLDRATGLIWLLFAFNMVVLAAWEWLARGIDWLDERWTARLVGVAGGVAITGLALEAIVGELNGLPIAIWAAWLGLIYFVYRHAIRDLFMLASACLSGIVFVVFFFARHLLGEGEAGSFLFLALLIVAMGAGSAIWLRKVQQQWQA